MLKLTKKVEFALIILKHLEEKRQTHKKESHVVLNVHEISSAHKISENFVAKVMQKLCQKQILLSKQGTQGGYYLNADLSQISLLQLLEVLEGHYAIVNCINKDKSCAYDDGCSIVDPMRHLNDKFRKIYKNITLSEVFTSMNNHKINNNEVEEKPLNPSQPVFPNMSFSNSQNKRWDNHNEAEEKSLPPPESISTKMSYNQNKKRGKFPILFLFLIFWVFSWVTAAEVNVYSYRQPFLIEGILDQFTKATGIKVNVIYINKGLTERVKLEGRRSPVDVILTTDIGQLIDLEDNKIIQSLDNEVINSAIPAHLRHSQGLWFALTTRARIIYASKDRVQEGEIQDYADLADPKWKKRICIRSGYHPYNLDLFASFIVHEGRAGAESFLKKLKGNLARKPQGNDRNQIKAIKEGMCDLSVGNSYYYAKMLFNYDEPEQIQWAKSVNLVFPNQGNRGTHYNVSGMALARYSPNRVEAVKLMEFLVSDLAQYIYSSENFEFPVKAGTPLPSFLKTYMSGVKRDEINLERVAAERKKVIQILDTIQFDR